MLLKTKDRAYEPKSIFGRTHQAIENIGPRFGGGVDEPRSPGNRTQPHAQ
jgi:hypothetical protein